jgi:hypothetical protein
MEDFFFASQEAKARRLMVSITSKEGKRAVALAKARNGKESRYGAMTYGNVCKGIEAHILGLFGEIAVTKAMGSPLDERIFEDTGDDGTDTEIPGVGRVGIKLTTYLEDPYLRVEKEHFDETLVAYILCALNKKAPYRVYVIGWATPAMVKAGYEKQFTENGPVNYVLQEYQLADIKTLKGV